MRVSQIATVEGKLLLTLAGIVLELSVNSGDGSIVVYSNGERCGMVESDILVEVSEHDIRTGRQRQCSSCPVAIAIHRTLGSNVDVSVVSSYTDGDGLVDGYIRLGYGTPTIPLPKIADDFVTAYDNYEGSLAEGELPMELRPFSFVLPRKLVSQCKGQQ